MKILSLDTSMGACSAAIVDTASGLPLAHAFAAMERGHAEALPPMVAEVLQESGLGLPRVDRIAVTTGPGTFTGVRIGLAFARGLGLARGIPVVGIDSLSAIAANERRGAPLLIVSDARNDEVYAAAFDVARNVISPPQVMTAAQAAALVPANSLVLGTAAAATLAVSGRTDLAVSTAGDFPVAAHFARLAALVSTGEVPAPLYLRAPDAKPQSATLRKIGALSIDTAGPAAAELLSDLHGEAFEEGWSEETFSALLATPGTQAAVAVAAEGPVAFLVTRSAADEAEIITIGTRPSQQRRGAARQLLERHAALLAEQGIKHIFLEVAASNTAAQGLYAVCGFREAGRRKGYYRRPAGAEDAIVMRCELRP